MAKNPRRRFAVRDSKIHGKGVFALVDIPKGELIAEYEGRRIPWSKALKMPPLDPENPNHTFFFDIDGTTVIDGNQGGNSSRFINHSCSPNCEAIQEERRGVERVFVHAKRDIRVGEELFYDYALMVNGRVTEKTKREFACFCGSKNCRGTMLALKEKKGKKEKKAKKEKKKEKKGKKA